MVHNLEFTGLDFMFSLLSSDGQKKLQQTFFAQGYCQFLSSAWSL